jgi:hypothetical protein
MSNAYVAGVINFLRPGYFFNGVTHDPRDQGHTLGGTSGVGRVANSSGIIGIEEDIAGDAHQNFVWYDTVAPEYRNLGNSDNGSIVDIDEAGFLLLYKNPAGQQKTYIYDPNTNTFTDQGSPATFAGTVPQALPVMMNASHQIAISGTYWVGSDLDPDNLRQHAFRAIAGVLTDVTPVETDAGQPPPGLCQPVAINSSGNIVGVSTNNVTDGFPRGFISIGGGVGTIMTGFSGEVDPIALNDSNIVVGSCDDGLGNFVAFSWTILGGPVFLPKLSGTTQGQANAINSAGWIVGEMDSKVFLYKNGATFDLGLILASIDPAWTAIFTAEFTNNHNQIVGFGTHSGLTKGYLLTLP